MGGKGEIVPKINSQGNALCGRERINDMIIDKRVERKKP